MPNIPYKMKLHDFTMQCRTYYRMLDFIADFEDKYSGKNAEEDITIETAPGNTSSTYRLVMAPDLLSYQLAVKQVKDIEDMFECIKEKCGENACDVLWDYYVENEKAEEVMDHFRFSSIRTLKRRISEWLHSMIDSLIPDTYFETYA